MWDALRKRLSTGLEFAIGIATLLSLALVVLVSLWYTTISDGPDSEIMLFAYPTNAQYLLKWVFGVVAAFAFAALLFVAWRVLDRVSPRILLVIALVLTSVFGIVWVSAQATMAVDFPDARNLISYATGFVSGDSTHFALSPGDDPTYPVEDIVSYFMHYPYQAGMLFYYMGMFKLFGAGNIMALRYANVAANEIVLLCIYAMGRRLLTTPQSRNALTIATTLFLPFWMSSAFPYANCVGFAFATTYVVCQVEALAAKSPRDTVIWAVASLAPLAIGLSVKSTFILLELAVIVAWVVRALRGKGIAGLAAALAIFVVVNGFTSAQTRALEHMLGTSVGEGMPKTSWILLGLTEESVTGQPGFWSLEPYQIYASANGSMDVQSQMVSERLKEIVANFASNPVYAAKFFARKLAIEWSDPTYMSLFYSIMNYDSNNTLFGYSADGTFLYDTPRNAFIYLYDGFQTVVYALSAVGVALALKQLRANAIEARDVLVLLCVCFCAGFYCYLLWESKGVYLLPFAVLLLPLCAYGLNSIAPHIQKKLPRPIADGRRE